MFSGEVGADRRAEAHHQLRLVAAGLAPFLDMAGFIRGITPDLRKRCIQWPGEQAGIALQHFAERSFWIFRDIAREAFQRAHRVVDRARQIRLRSAREVLQGFMQVIGGGGTLRGLQRLCSLAHHRFKGFRAARGDLPINQLPANAFFLKETVDGFRELHGVLLPAFRVMLGKAGNVLYLRFQNTILSLPSELP
jgi:hypothetical protein